ncbi:MAG TPA: hypothetical protein VGC07_03670 [Granulicella sp.]
MRMRLRSIGLLLVGATACTRLPAQMHKVAKQETVVRAVSVYEWVGDFAKPTSSRLIPVTLFINNTLEDAGLYLARPVPLALETGTIYELSEAGVPKGTLNLSYARHLQAATAAEAYDDGWFGYGTFHGPASPKKTEHKLEQARTAGIEGSEGIIADDRPHFVNRAGKPITPASSTGASTSDDKGATETSSTADPDRPHLTRKKDSSSDASPSDSSGKTSSGDPDRPTMKRRSGNDTSSSATASSPDPGSTPADDPDRPTLKRHPAESKRPENTEASVSTNDKLNDDPDRPMLHRGRPADSATGVEPAEMTQMQLKGLPVDVQQMAAVSDAANRPVHDFSRPWEDTEERAAILTKMQAFAQAQLAAYGAAAPPPPPTPKPGANSKLRRPLKPLKKAEAVPLLDEQLRGYLLSYGDVPTFVYHAHTDGDGAAARYVTIVAQLNTQQEPQMVLHSVTDATHLDRTPRMRLVDAVDVEASNRASLLFELRGQQSRQFAVYRVLGMRAQQTFSTGTMQ